MRPLLSLTAIALVAAAPAPKLLPGFSKDANGMCHRRDGIYAPCDVAAPAYTYLCKDGTYRAEKAMKGACKAHGGVGKVL